MQHPLKDLKDFVDHFEYDAANFATLLSEPSSD